MRAERARQKEREQGYVSTMTGKTHSAGHYHFFAVAQYILHHNIASFRTNMTDAAECAIYVFEQYEAGKIDYPFDGSEVSVTAYRDVFEALASGNWEVSIKLAVLVGGRPEIEKRSNDFARSLCYTLKYCILREFDAMKQKLSLFKQVCKEEDYLAFQGFADVFQAILEDNLQMANDGIQRIAADHSKLAKQSAWFAETEDELLSVWGIGIANLARRNGLQVHGVPPFIPDDLLV